MAAATGANSAASSADLLTDLKSGYLLGANPRRQFIAQFIGIFFGTLAVVPAWYLMVPTKEKLEAFNPPATNMWRAVAELLAGGGLNQLPPSAKMAIVIGCAGRRNSAAVEQAAAQSCALPAFRHGPGVVMGDGFQATARLSPSVRSSSGSGPSSMPVRPRATVWRWPRGSLPASRSSRRSSR